MKLYYFDIYGRAESIRMLAAHAKLPLENDFLADGKFMKLKEEGVLEFGQVPMLTTEDGKNLCQSWAILRVLGRTHGYYPSDPESAWRVDSTIDACEDYFNIYFKTVFEKDPEVKAKLTENFLKFVPVWLDAIEKRISSNESQKFIVGSKMTIADIALAAVGFNLILNEANPNYAEVAPLIKDREVLKAYANNLKEELKEYLATRPQPRPY